MHPLTPVFPSYSISFSLNPQLSIGSLWCLHAMFARYSRKELLSINKRAPPAIPYSIFSHLRISGLCIHRPTKRSRKRRRCIHHPQQNQQLAILCLLNARLIVNKSAPLGELLNDVQPGILAITETWLTPTYGDNDLVACCPPGYSSVHVPRATGRGGGVALLFNSTIAFRFPRVGMTHAILQQIFLPVKVWIERSYTYEYIILNILEYVFYLVYPLGIIFQVFSDTALGNRLSNSNDGYKIGCGMVKGLFFSHKLRFNQLG